MLRQRFLMRRLTKEKKTKKQKTATPHYCHKASLSPSTLNINHLRDKAAKRATPHSGDRTRQREELQRSGGQTGGGEMVVMSQR